VPPQDREQATGTPAVAPMTAQVRPAAPPLTGRGTLSTCGAHPGSTREIGQGAANSAGCIRITSAVPERRAPKAGGPRPSESTHGTSHRAPPGLVPVPKIVGCRPGRASKDGREEGSGAHQWGHARSGGCFRTTGHPTVPCLQQGKWGATVTDGAAAALRRGAMGS